MDDIQYLADYPLLATDQAKNLAASIRYSFVDKLSRADFTDHLLMFLEDIPGFESGEVTAALIESAWALYGAKP